MPRRMLLPPDADPRSKGPKIGGWWHESNDGQKVVCDLCPRGCVLGSGKRGFCFVRENLDGRIVLSTYNRSTGFCIDPIEKKPLNQFYPGTSVLSFGTAGCNLGCKFCQNWSISKSREVASLSEMADPEAIALAAREHGCRSVAFTYNDPIVWAEYAIDTARACHRHGVQTVAVTSGYIAPAARGPFFEAIDAANVDLKGFSESFYRKWAAGHLAPVLDTLRWLVHQSQVWVEITNLLIPGENDSAHELERMCAWIVEELGPEVPLHFSAFHPDFQMKDRPRTPPATLGAAYEIAVRAGLRYVYTGNVSDRQRQRTHCPGCGRVLIERDGYDLVSYALARNRCRHCDAAVAGRFDDLPGTWGSKRQPVRIAASGPGTKPNQPTSEGETRMADAHREPGGVTRIAPERPDLSGENESTVFQAAARRVAAAVQSVPGERLEDVLVGTATVPVLGAFVSLKRSGQLRSCCGYLGHAMPLHEALDHAAVRAAREDPRFPPISPTELEHLDMEVWLLWGLEPVAAQGEDRVQAVTIGRHGLQIARGTSRGLLLPGVAVDNNLDARAFLEQVCRKAGLPKDAWKDDATTLMTFEGYALHGPLASGLGAGPPEAVAGGPTGAEITALAAFCRQNLISLIHGATPSYYLAGGFDDNVCGVTITVHLPGETSHFPEATAKPPGESEKLECSKLSLRPDVPLQTALFDLVQTTAQALQSRRIAAPLVQAARLGVSVFADSALHGTGAKPDLKGLDPSRRALMAYEQSKWALRFDAERSPDELLGQVLEAGRFSQPERVALCSFAVATTEPRLTVAQVPETPDVRRPAVAGAFYPSAPAEIAQLLDDLIPPKRSPETWAAAMVPHAGWVYSGRLAAAVFSRIAFPPQVIVLCPRHRPVGANWAVAPYSSWTFPGGQVASDPDLAKRLADSIDGLEHDASAHAQEHAIEVQLPLVARLAPEARVVGIALRSGDLPSLEQFSEQLAGVLDGFSKPPLLVISSDMHHEGTDEESRRLDRLALDRIAALDPAGLLETVRQNGIKMCGVLPAVLVMQTLRRLGALNECEEVGYATSADATGDTTRVVGYAGLLFR